MHESHLLVACHGMWGEPIHLSEMARIIREKFPPDAVDADGIGFRLLIAETNTLDSTYDGIDWGGERIADEVQKKIEELEVDGTEKVTRFSAVGYSLGGLLIRYLIGILNSRKFFDTVKPINFTTFATPHVGIVRTNLWFSKLAYRLGPKMLSRTGPQFYGTDSWSASGRPLLEVLADPNGVFYQGLAKFERLSLYGSAFGDRTVAYSTALIEREDPFLEHTTNGMTFIVDEKYSPIITSYTVPSSSTTPPPEPSITTAEYWKTALTKQRLPPIFQLRFPFNAIIVLLLPLIFPLGLTAAYVKVSLDAKSSRKRLRQLEKDESFQNRLVNVLKRVDKGMENVIADLIEAGGEQAGHADDVPVASTSHQPEDNSEPVPAPTRSRLLASPSPSVSSDDEPVGETKGLCKRKRAAETETRPILSDLQLKIIDQLNTLSLNKYAAYFPGVFSSHAVIISRDIKRFEFHAQGHGVLKHWADHFIL